MEKDRYKLGLETLERIMGEQAHLVLDLQEVAPDFTRYTVEVFGDIYANPALDVKTRELVTVAALTTLGYAPTQLRAHINGALNVGATQREVVEVITQIRAYAGFPAAQNAINIAKEAFAARDTEEKV